MKIANILDENTKEKISSNQFKFRKGRSTINAIRKVTEIVKFAGRHNYRYREYTALITLDIKNAFDSAEWKGIMKEIEKMKVREDIKNLIYDYLKDRE